LENRVEPGAVVTKVVMDRSLVQADGGQGALRRPGRSGVACIPRMPAS
jgi:hypothetical protein